MLQLYIKLYTITTAGGKISMLWVKSWHIIALVAWFAGLFYLPRLFVYHATTNDAISLQRFQVMERRLYYGIMYPAGILTTLFGLWLLSYGFSAYLKMGWMHAKLALVALLWGYHLCCGHYRRALVHNPHVRSAKFFRIFNELPTILLIGIVILAVVKPW
jgi:protoporphyrinogen IX oxidase